MDVLDFIHRIDSHAKSCGGKWIGNGTILIDNKIRVIFKCNKCDGQFRLPLKHHPKRVVDIKGVDIEVNPLNKTSISDSNKKNRSLYRRKESKKKKDNHALETTSNIKMDSFLHPIKE